MSDTEQKAPTDIVNLLINFGIHFAIACICLFSVSQLRPRNSLVYAKKEKYYGAEEKFKRPPKLKPGLFRWLRDLAVVDDMKILQYIGPDALVALRFMKNAAKMFGWLALLGVVVVIPLYLVAGAVDNKTEWDTLKDSYNGTEKAQLRLLTLQMVRRGSAFIWVPIIGSFVMTAIVLWYLYRMASETLAIRRAYLQSPEYLEAVHSRTLVLLNIPEKSRTTKGVAEILNSMNLGVSPRAIHVAHELGTLSEETTEYTKLVLEFEGIMTKYLDAKRKEQLGISKSKKPVEHPIVRVDNKVPFIGGKKVDALDHFPTKLHSKEEHLYDLRLETEGYDPTAYAFVVFSSISAASQALAAMKQSEHLSQSLFATAKPMVQKCPGYENMKHQHAELTKSTLLRRNMVAVTCTIILVIVWSAFSAAVMTLTKLSTLQPYVPELANWLDSNKVANFIFTSFAPPIVLILLQVLLSFLLRSVVQYKGFISQSKEDMNLMRWLFVFAVWNTVVLNAAGVLIPNIQIIFDPSKYDEAASMLSFSDNMLQQGALAFANSSYFFMNLIVTQYSSYYIAWVQLGPLLVTFIKQRFLTLSWRDRLNLLKPIPYQFELVLSGLMIPVLVGLLYALISPLILVFCTLTFYIVWLSAKHQLLYIFETANESGARWFWRIYEALAFSLLVSLVILLIYVRVFSGTRNVELVILVPIIAVLVFLFFVHTRIRRPFYAMLPPKDYTPKSSFGKDKSTNLSSETLNEWISGDDVDSSKAQSPFADRSRHTTAVCADEDGDGNEDFVNPLLVNPLECVQVWPWLQPQLDAIYRPKYENFSQYLSLRVTSPSTFGYDTDRAEHLNIVRRKATVFDRQRKEKERRVNRLLLAYEKEHKLSEIATEKSDTKSVQAEKAELNEIDRIIGDYSSPRIESDGVETSPPMYLDSLESQPAIINTDDSTNDLQYVGRSKSQMRTDGNVDKLQQPFNQSDLASVSNDNLTLRERDTMDTYQGQSSGDWSQRGIFEEANAPGARDPTYNAEFNNGTVAPDNFPRDVSQAPRPSNTDSLTAFLQNSDQNASDYASYLRYADNGQQSPAFGQNRGPAVRNPPFISTRTSSVNLNAVINGAESSSPSTPSSQKRRNKPKGARNFN